MGQFRQQSAKCMVDFGSIDTPTENKKTLIKLLKANVDLFAQKESGFSQTETVTMEYKYTRYK